MPGLRAVTVSGPVVCREMLIGFRAGLYGCLRGRADALFEVADAVLTARSGALAGGTVGGEGIPAWSRRPV
jgi:hypothetical protein